ncbi:hypothetical protein M3182_04565 [Mesobacillus maritimus]|uniref:hypothetical protein n=1 Tax=Mesobacillus maritimus TaxID=1643336 RepID=UPI00203FBA18|nr:hypothetical protein [Mesobacillus maritimus]MCM3585019.1 hypothetical protein [Mesobacillus maritimus]
MEDIKEQIKTDLEYSHNRHRSIPSLPNLDNSKIRCITEILICINQNKNLSIKELCGRLIELVNISYNTARLIIPTLEKVELVIKSNNKLHLTNRAINYIKTKDIRFISKGFIINYFGFLEMLYLVNDIKPQKINEVFFEWERCYNKLYGSRSLSTNKVQFSRIYTLLVQLNYLYYNNGNIHVNKEAYLHLRRIDNL